MQKTFARRAIWLASASKLALSLSVMVPALAQDKAAVVSSLPWTGAAILSKAGVVRAAPFE